MLQVAQTDTTHSRRDTIHWAWATLHQENDRGLVGESLIRVLTEHYRDYYHAELNPNYAYRLRYFLLGIGAFTNFTSRGRWAVHPVPGEQEFNALVLRGWVIQGLEEIRLLSSFRNRRLADLRDAFVNWSGLPAKTVAVIVDNAVTAGLLVARYSAGQLVGLAPPHRSGELDRLLGLTPRPLEHVDHEELDLALASLILAWPNGHPLKSTCREILSAEGFGRNGGQDHIDAIVAYLVALKRLNPGAVNTSPVVMDSRRIRPDEYAGLWEKKAA